ncbi:hypothetical protein Tco_0233494 [Tanacetum coccineum]
MAQDVTAPSRVRDGQVTSTFRHPEVPNTSIKLLLFPFLSSRRGWEARDWLDKELLDQILERGGDLASRNLYTILSLRKHLSSKQNPLLALPRTNEPSTSIGTFQRTFLLRCVEKFSHIESKIPKCVFKMCSNDSRAYYKCSFFYSSTFYNSFEIQQMAALTEDKMNIDWLVISTFGRADTFLALADDPTSPEVDEAYYDHKSEELKVWKYLAESSIDVPPVTFRKTMRSNNREGLIKDPDVIKKEVEKLLDADGCYIQSG